MSYLQNNHNHRPAAHSGPEGSLTNGGQSFGSYHHVENDFLNRNFSTPSQAELSAQLTRPTSKTALLVRQRRAMLEQLSCSICKGFLIDATTIDDCMDSFCRSCIIIHLRSNHHCPKCGVLIQRPNPLAALRPDKVLQDIVYKSIPGLYDNEMRRRRDFYRQLHGTSTSSSDEEDSSSSLNGPTQNSTGEKYGQVARPKPFYKPTDSVDLSIEPQTRGDSTTIFYDNKRQSIVTCFTGNLQLEPSANGSVFSSVDIQHFKTYLRCPAKLTVLQLKKFIAAKFNTCRDDTIHLLYLNESLKDEYSLIDVAYIYDWRAVEHMRLYYIIEREISKTSCSTDLASNNGQPRSSKISRPSVGISTQTVKRVCIDPQPKTKFYEINNEDETSGRSMRSRETSSSSTSTTTRTTSTSTASQVTQTPIIRPYSSRECSAPSNSRSSSSSNGIADRQVVINTVVNNQKMTHQTPYRHQSQSASSNDASSNPRKKSELKESRSLRSQHSVPDPTPGSIPKINISLSALNRGSSHARDPEASDSSKAKQANADRGNNIVSLPRGNITQLLPYSPRGYTAATTAATQSSVVTLASFTEARSNHVMTMSSSTTTSATISDSYKNLIGANSSSHLQTKNNLQQSKVQAPPQLALSFVTKRGIIIRRLNNQDELSGTSTNGSSNDMISRPPNVPALPAPPQGDSHATNNISASQVSSPQSYHQTTSTRPSVSPHTSGHRTGEGGISPRHHAKVKPVYKTFVDPTKLKSPNFKKLGYTARH